MIKEPWKLGGKPVNNRKDVKKYVKDRNFLDFAEFHKQWDRMLAFIEQDAREAGISLLPPMLKCRNEYLDYILKEKRSPEDMGSLEPDIFSAQNTTGFRPSQEKIFSSLNLQIRKYERTNVQMSEKNPDYPYWICARNRRRIFSEVKESHIQEERKQWLFCILTALYCRMEILYEEYPVQFQRLELLLNGMDGEKRFAQHMISLLTGEEKEIELLPLENSMPYVLPVDTGEEAYQNTPLQIRRLYRRNGSTAEPVTVCFCREKQGKTIEKTRIVLKEGEFCDILVTKGGTVLRILPYMSFNKEDVLLCPGKGDMRLLLFHRNQNPQRGDKPRKEWTEEQCRGITSFAADGRGGFLAVQDGKILLKYVMEDMIYFDSVLNHEKDRKTEVVETWMENGYYFFLKKDGGVISNSPDSQSFCQRELCDTSYT